MAISRRDLLLVRPALARLGLGSMALPLLASQSLLLLAEPRLATN
jgi:hypothetical protein